MPSRNSSPARPLRLASTATVFEFRARPAVKALARHFDPAELRLRQRYDDAAKTAVPHQQVRAASQDEELPAALMAASQDGGQILF